MTLTKPKPKIQRSYVTVTDGLTKKSEHITVYGAVPMQVISVIRQLLSHPEDCSAAAKEGSTPAAGL